MPLNPNVALVDVAWGIVGADYVESDDPDIDDDVVAVYDDTFNLTDPRAQAHIVWVCDYFRNASTGLVQQVCRQSRRCSTAGGPPAAAKARAGT